jgi:hypothetical protein
MTSNHDLANVIVLGFDLGHGETALTYIEGCENKSHDIFPVFCQVSAIGYLADGEAICGEDVLLNASASNGESFDIGFKSKPGIYPPKDKKISDFAKAVYEKVLYETPQLQNKTKNIETFIGCPTGWLDKKKKEVLEAYKKLFIKAGIPNPKIVAESDAAFAYYFEVVQKQQPKNDGITLKELQSPIIVLDFGSSTLDVTIGKNLLGEPISLGIPLGASLIDKAILEWNLSHCLDDNYPLRTRINDKYVDKLKKLLSEKHSLYARAEFYCRQFKEKYFNNQKAYSSISAPLKKSEYFDDDPLHICLWGELMNQILKTPLKQLIPDFFKNNKDSEIDELAGYSWLGRCEQLLKDDLDKKLLENGLSREDIGVVVLTGGASKMQPVRDLVQKYFPKSKNLKFDADPGLCISRGLSCFGRIDVQTRHFEEEIDAFCEDKLLKIIEKYYSSTKLVEIIGDKLAEITKSKLNSWRNKSIEAERIAYWIKKELGDWSQSDELKGQIKKEIERLEREISKEVNQSLKPICEKYGLGNINLLPSSFLNDDLFETAREFRKEYEINYDNIKDKSFSFVSLMQELAQALVKDINKAWKDNQLENLGNGFGWWRNWKYSEDDANSLISKLRQIMKNAVASFLANESVTQLPVLATYFSLKTVLKRRVKGAKYLIYSF